MIPQEKVQDTEQEIEETLILRQIRRENKQNRIKNSRMGQTLITDVIPPPKNFHSFATYIALAISLVFLCMICALALKSGLRF